MKGFSQGDRVDVLRDSHPATVVNLTGRDIPGMGQTTYDSMRKLGFPYSGDRVHLILKNDPTIHDLDFKITALEDVARLGDLIVAF